MLVAGFCSIAAPVKKNVVDEVAWIVGDEAIFRSDVEEQYAQMRSEGRPVNGDPYCVIPEQLAVEKLFLHQAKIDTVTAPENQVASQVDKRIDFLSRTSARAKRWRNISIRVYRRCVCS